MITLILVIIVISLLILVHEWGHFYSARKLGVKVEEFGFGFPPKIFSVVRKGVRYSFNLFPLGGFVKIFGEHGEGEGSKESFISRAVWQRFIILAAGVFMNIILAWIFFSIGSAIGIPRAEDNAPIGTPVSIIGVAPGSPAEKAGLRLGDKILEIHADEVSLVIEKEQDVQDFVSAFRGEEIVLTLKRGEELFTTAVIPRIDVPKGEGPLGIALARIVVERAPWYLAPVYGAEILGRTIITTVLGLWSVLRDLAVARKAAVDVAGPVGIYFFARDTWALGFVYFLQFSGALSVSLAILNFLPIPALDGGRILFLAIEKIKGSRVNPRIENFMHTVGFALLILLMVLITYRDVTRIL